VLSVPFFRAALTCPSVLKLQLLYYQLLASMLPYVECRKIKKQHIMNGQIIPSIPIHFGCLDDFRILQQVYTTWTPRAAYKQQHKNFMELANS